MEASPATSCTGECHCTKNIHTPQFIVLTGGPGAGKTAVLELVQKVLCPHITVLPESASILFKGGFWRRNTLPAKKSAQRAIFHVQKELERTLEEEKQTALGLCDRGSIDGLAYWPNSEESYWQELNTSKEIEYKRYTAIIHLRTPEDGNGYNHQNPVRIETAKQALAIDEKLLKVWQDHPNRIVIDSTTDFMDKANHAINAIQKYIPKCCHKE